MLSADKNVTLTEFQIQTLQIREKELNYFVSLYNSISGIAAMLAGFGFSSLKMSFPSNTSIIIQIVYLAITASAIGLELCAILNAACCSVFESFKCANFDLIFLIFTNILGPGKFLRGQGGLKAAEQAVSVLEEKSEITLAYFMLGLYCIVLSSAFKAFILYTLWNACIVAAGLALMTYILVTTGKRIFTNMYVDKDKAIRGKIERDQIHDPTNIKFQ